MSKKNELRSMKAKGKGFNKMKVKIAEYYAATNGETRAKAAEQLKTGCIELFMSVIGEEKFRELKNLNDSGAPIEKILAKIESFKAELQDENKKRKVNEYELHCKEFFITPTSSRKKRETVNEFENYYNTYLSWLNDQQKAELNQLKANGKGVKEIKAKIQEYYAGISGEKKITATEKLKGGCVELFRTVYGEEKFQEIKQLKDSGTSIEKIMAKIAELNVGLNDSSKAKVTEYGPHCQKLFSLSLSRKRRDVHDHKQHHSLNDYYKTHLAWLNDAQKEELNKMKSNGKEFKDMKNKIDQFYAATTGETRAKATELLSTGCMELFKLLYGEEKVQEIKQMQENRASLDEISRKIEELQNGLQENQKAKGVEYISQCKSLLSVAQPSRKRRSLFQKPSEIIQHSFMEYPQNHLKWLTNEQIYKLKIEHGEGTDPVEIQRQIFSMYTQINEEETMAKANLHLKRDCVNYFTTIINKFLSKLDAVNQQYNEISTYKSLSIISQILAEYLTQQQTQLWQLYSHECYHLFPLANSYNNVEHYIVTDHFRQAFDKYVKTDYQWLDEQQKMELNTFINANSDEERIQLLDKIFHFFDVSEGQAKEAGEFQLKYTCTKISVWFTIKLKEHLNALLTSNEIENPTKKTIHMVNEIAGQLKNVHMSALFRKSVDRCTPLLYNVKRARRHLEHHGAHTLEDYFKTHLAWLTDLQKDELKKMKSEGKSRSDLQAKALEYYSMTTGETRRKASELLKSGCIELFKTIFGDEKFNEVEKLKESEQIFKKIDEFSAALENKYQKAQIKEYSRKCKEFFGAPPSNSTRRRRHIEGEDHVHAHEHHSLQDYLNTHLSWLTDAQKNELSKMKEGGKGRNELYAKVEEYYESTTGERRSKATNLLKGACREMFINVFGEGKLNEIRNLKTNGAQPQEIASAIEGYANSLTDETKKTKVQLYMPHCKKLYAQPEERTRRDIRNYKQHQVDDYYKTHLVWPNNAQKREIKQVKAKEIGISDIMNFKTPEYYVTDETKKKPTELLEVECIELFKHIFGEKKFREVKQLKESGTSIDKISAKILKYQAELVNPTKKMQAEDCKKLYFNSAQRRRRNIHRKKHRSLLDYFETHLSWLTESQKKSVWNYESNGYPDDRLQKMIESFYLSTTGEKRQNATRLLRSACNEMLTALFGDDTIAEIEGLQKSGVSASQLNDRVDALIDELDTEDERTKARDYAFYCRLNAADEKADENV